MVVLENASLKTIKSNKGNFELLNCDDHLSKHKRFKLNPKDSRPDILHQELLILQDSVLNKAGLLKIYVRSSDGVLIDIHPSIRFPRTFKRFAGISFL